MSFTFSLLPFLPLLQLKTSFPPITIYYTRWSVLYTVTDEKFFAAILCAGLCGRSKVTSLPIFRTICLWSKNLLFGQICWHTPCVCYSLELLLVSELFHAHHKPSGGESVFLIVLTFCWFLHIMAVKLPFTFIIMSPCLSFIFCAKFNSIWFLFGLRFPQQFIVLLCISSNNVGD